MKKYLFFSAILMLSLLTGCASIVNGTQEKITVTTPPVKDAKCKLKNNEGSWSVNKTPGVVIVHRAHGPLEIDCKKSGYMEAKKQVTSYANGTTAGNLVFGGAIGAGIDMASGAAYKYPQTIIMPMRKIV